MTFKVPNEYRKRTGPLASDDSIGLCGAFEIPVKRRKVKEKKFTLVCIADDGCHGFKLIESWEHVSCYKHDGLKRYIPSWHDMCFVKSLFWDEEDCVVQYHPPKSDYVNHNPFVLHLWRPVELPLPLPPKELV